MGIFSRNRRGEDEPEEFDTTSEPAGAGDEEQALDGPFDDGDAPEDGRPRMDLGSVRVPVPDGSQVQVEMDQQTNNVRAVHVVTPHGQVTISAYAAPRSGGLWKDVSNELTEQLRSDGAKVSAGRGEWGIELSAIVGEVALRFVGVDGPRWMLRGVIAGPQSQAAHAPQMLNDIVRDTIVVRGDAPMPPRTPLPIKLPDAVAEHILEQQGQQQQAQQQQRQQQQSRR
ncbi:hypothetical protein BAY61_11185 [Prauserella marina]|uniref:Uncharacterized protein n=1 Tax=Prauserella marina TaxID=530584 RepID=A0A222VNH7_9PSEU|nr:DUF3710 domain-containing protein [Prauserella marina]ASR35469.1 hypothetical protein BAY61_11185 [Prauserella marina]PWV84713.1 uncharacterized protein DUF3710 [Prauserella marina]SDC15065.1 Protein of unknown function [Prauserella marina]